MELCSRDQGWCLNCTWPLRIHKLTCSCHKGGNPSSKHLIFIKAVAQMLPMISRRLMRGMRLTGGTQQHVTHLIIIHDPCISFKGNKTNWVRRGILWSTSKNMPEWSPSLAIRRTWTVHQPIETHYCRADVRWRKMVRRWQKERKGRVGWERENMTVRETGIGLVPPTIESMREPRMSRREAPEMGGIGDTMPWNQGNPHWL